MSDLIVTKTKIYLTVIDRILVLFGNTLYVTVKIETENIVGKTESTSYVEVSKFFKNKKELNSRSYRGIR